MRQWITLEKATLIIVLLLFAAAALSLPFRFANKASAPSLNIGGNSSGDNHVIETPPPVVVPEVSADIVAPEPSPEAPYIEDFEDFITVRMDVSDVSRGSLVLINNNYLFNIPENHGFVTIPEPPAPAYRVGGDGMLLSNQAIEPLHNMLSAFYDETGSDSIVVISAFRDYEKQQETLNDYISRMGRAEALRWAAPPGHSEHQAGLAVDFGIYSGGDVRTFSDTGVNAWFKDNSYRFGFIHRFPESKTDVTETAPEPWHFRYVGDPHAYLMYENDWCLEEYIELIRGYSFGEPIGAFYNGEEYAIYFTMDIDVPIPFDCDFDISGNNVDGFIVTLKY